MLEQGAPFLPENGEGLIVEDIRNEDFDKGMVAVEIVRVVLNNGKDGATELLLVGGFSLGVGRVVHHSGEVLEGGI